MKNHIQKLISKKRPMFQNLGNYALLILCYSGMIFAFGNLNTETYAKNEEKVTYVKTINPNISQGNTNPEAFISVWNTAYISYSSSARNQVKLPLQERGIYNFLVDWGDNTSYFITNSNLTTALYTYSREGVYVIKITGIFKGWQFNGLNRDRLKLLEIQQWGCFQLINLGAYFVDCKNLQLTATDNLNLTGITSLNNAFANCVNLGSVGNLNGWDVSRVTKMMGLFDEAKSFNQPIGDWNVSSVTDMREMFKGADSFNQPIGTWNVSKVSNMDGMFYDAVIFNQPIGEWDVSNVITMNWMFDGAKTFNQPLEDWDVSSVIVMRNMFSGAKTFNQHLEDWDVSNVTYMTGMFSFASNFNQPIGEWNVSNVIDMSWMFAGVTLSTANYDHLLLGWSKLSLQDGVNFDAGKSICSEEIKATKKSIINTYGWEITDGSVSDPGIPGYALVFFVTIGLLAIVGIAHKTKHTSLRN